MAPSPGELSPHLLPFLLAQLGGSEQDSPVGKKSNRATKAGLLPQSVPANVFANIGYDSAGSYKALDTINNAMANKRADSDALHATRMQKKQAAAAAAAYKKQQAAYAKQQKKMYDKLAKLIQNGQKSSYGSGPSVPYMPPSSSTLPKNSDATILPKIQPVPAPQVAPNPGQYGETHIGPAPEPKKECPLWKKLLGMC